MIYEGTSLQHAAMPNRFCILFLLIPQLIYGQFNTEPVLRADHLYLWRGLDYLADLPLQQGLDTLNGLVSKEDLNYFQSLVYMANDRIPEAVASIVDYALSPDYRYAYESQLLAGLLHHKRGSLSLAMAAFEKAIKMDGARYEAYLEKIKLFSDGENYVVGIDHANEAIRKFPHRDLLYLYRGLLYNYEGLFKRARKDVGKVIGSDQGIDDPHMAQAHSGLSRCYLGQDDVTKAELHIQESLLLAPQDPVTLGLLGEIRYAQGDLKGALQAFESMLGLRNSIHYYPFIADINQELGQTKVACKYYKASCQADYDTYYVCKRVRKLNCD